MGDSPTVLIASGPLRGQAGRFREILTQAGCATLDPPGGHALGVEDLLAHLPACDAVVAGGEPYTARLIESCPRLKIIARTGVGYDAVDVEAATARGVVVTITPGTNHESVAEQAFALLLAVTRRVAWNDRIIRAGGWDRTLVMPLRGKTIGLVGLGRIGRAMIPRAEAFGMNILAYDPVLPEQTGMGHGFRLVTFEELIAASDIVSLHCPLTNDTRCLFDRRVFSRMRPGSILINTSRGAVVVEADLHEALTAGRLAGAGLDVLEPEPPASGNPLLGLDNVVVSPHIAGIDTRAMADMAESAAQSIVDHLGGRIRRDCVVNPSVLPPA
jgi:phosphoglycerate dehydrogenase-like enzyme